jgi:hypothetical protein
MINDARWFWAGVFIIGWVFVLLISSYAKAQSVNLALPQSPSSYQSDRFRIGDKDCSNAIGSATNVEFGVVGLLDQPGYDIVGQQSFNDYNRNVGVYARITIPLDAPEERINCNTLYQLALERERLEVQRLKQEIANLKALKFEGDDNGGN